MLDDHDTRTELRRQLDVLHKRIDETVADLAEARGSLSAAGLGAVSVMAMTEGKGDLFQLCVRAEVALAETREAVQQLAHRLRQLQNRSDAATIAASDAPPPDPFGGTRRWHS
jgi:hypothetical protein